MEEPHEQEADRLEREADRMEAAGDEVGGEIEALREDWDSKKKSNLAAGAMDPADSAPGGLGEQEEDSDDESGEASDDEGDEDYISGDDSGPEDSR